MNVKPHDLAIVVGCWDKRFNGAVCTVLGPPPSDLPVAKVIDSPYWSVRFGHPMPWTHGWRADLREGSFPDCWLRKISGPFGPMGETKEDGKWLSRLKEFERNRKETA